jgi:hypothetical protein
METSEMKDAFEETTAWSALSAKRRHEEEIARINASHRRRVTFVWMIPLCMLIAGLCVAFFGKPPQGSSETQKAPEPMIDKATADSLEKWDRQRDSIKHAMDLQTEIYELKTR